MYNYLGCEKDDFATVLSWYKYEEICAHFLNLEKGKESNLL